MDQADLKSRRFRVEREADWRRLESVLDRFESGRSSELSDDEVVAIPVLYRSVLSSLSAARAVSLDQSLISYLEALSTRAYFCVYGTRTSLFERLSQFLLQDWRAGVRSLWRETIVSAAFGIFGTVVAFYMVRTSARWFFAFVPVGLSGGRDPGASTDDLRSVLFESQNSDILPFFSSYLFTHNAEIALLSFALGFACCLPTVFLLFYNGLILGALFALYFEHGLAVDFGGWVLIHGVTELFAITLSGAAGFKIGWTLAFPGQASRLDAMSVAGRQAASTMVGVVIMLAVAGLLEGFARQLVTNTSIRYIIAAATALGWLAFYYAPAKRP
jgi:uncharacterized membrane protein SpoIIM required for sporulation